MQASFPGSLARLLTETMVYSAAETVPMEADWEPGPGAVVTTPVPAVLGQQ